MTINYTNEMKLPMPDGLPYNWVAIINGIVEALDAGAELTFTFGENVAAGDAVALKTTDGKIYKAKSEDSTLTPAIGFSPNLVGANSEGRVRWFGWIDVDTSWSAGDQASWSPGECAYVGSVAGRLAKTQYSWANPVGYAKGFTNASYITRFAIHPHHRCTEVVRDLIIQKKAVFAAEYDNGNSGASKTIDWRNGNKQRVTLTGDCSLAFVNPQGATTVTLKLIQDGTGSRSPNWPGVVRWPGSSIPELTSDPNAVDIVCLYHDGANYYGSSGLDFK